MNALIAIGSRRTPIAIGSRAVTLFAQTYSKAVNAGLKYSAANFDAMKAEGPIQCVRCSEPLMSGKHGVNGHSYKPEPEAQRAAMKRIWGKAR